MRAEKKKRKREKNQYPWLKRILLLLAVMIPLSLGILAGYYGQQLEYFFADIQGEELEPELGDSANDQLLSELRPFALLLMGVDEREDDAGRADTLIVATVNPHSSDIKLLSIPRDTLITLPGTEGQLDKINAPYAYDGIPYTIETVEAFLDIPVTFYAQINFQGLVSLVDAVGGIDVYADFAFTVQDSEENSNAIEIKEGLQQLNGEEALGYARMRKQDPQGDWGRQERQREVIQSLVDELISLNTFTNFNSILSAIGPNLETNLQAGQMWAIANRYSHAAEKIDTLMLDGYADYEYFPSYGQEVYVWVPYEDVLDEVQTELQKHLDLDEESSASGILDDTSETDSSTFEEDTEEFDTNRFEDTSGY